ncbi:N-6 DNA methylase [Pectinatus frisingensis]|uniref:N-6 DNA methylase n=1 Tax=Pectinatus frisingensis TaxID=865 RepID=UPI003D806AF8
MKNNEIKTIDQFVENKVIGNILDRVKAREKASDYFLSVVSLSAIAYLYKMSGNKSNVLKMIPETIKDEMTVIFLTNYAKKYWTDVEAISETTEASILKDIVVSYIPTEFNTREIGEFVTPKGVTKLVIQLLDIKKEDIVLNLCSGAANFLIEASYLNEKPYLIGVDINTSMIQLSNIRTAFTDDLINIIQGNMLSQDFSKLQANKVFADFPFMVRGWYENIRTNKNLYPYFANAKKTVSSDWVYATAAMLTQAKPGRTVIRMSNAGLWNEVDQDIRKTFILSGLVEAVISMPEKLLDTTTIPFTLIILSQDNKSIRMVDASEFYTTGRRQNTLEDNNIQDILAAYHSNSAKSKLVTIEELKEQEYILNPLRYISIPNLADKMIKSVKLGDIVCTAINRGAVVKSSELDQLVSTQPTEYQYLMLKDISNGHLNKELPYLVNLDEKYDKFYVKNGNLIISKISPFKVAMVEIDDSEKVLANGNLYFLDIDETKANPVYVMLYLQSEAGMMQLNSLAKGSAMKSISIKDLQKIIIPDIPLKQQNKIANDYYDLNNELIVISRQEVLIRNKIEHLVEEVL